MASARYPKGHRRVATPLLLLLLLVIVFGAGCGDDDDPTSAPSPATAAAASPTAVASTPATGGVTAVADAGFEVVLRDVEFTPQRTIVTFRITDVAPDQPPAIDAYEGLLPADMTLENLAWQGEEFGELDAVFADETTLLAIDEQLFFGPVADPTTPVTIAWTRMTFQPGSPGSLPDEITGNWSFQFVPADVE